MPDYDFNTIRQVLATEPGQDLRRYLTDRLSELAFIEAVPQHADPVAQAVALEAQRRAHEILRDILMHIADIQETGIVTSKESFASGID